MRTENDNRVEYLDIKDVYFIWRGTQSDPLLEYDGKQFNYWDITDSLWDEFKENNSDALEDDFDMWLKSNPDYLYGYLNDVVAGGYFD